MDVRKWLQDYMEARDPRITDLALAERLGYNSNSPISQVRRGVIKIPANRITDWADALASLGTMSDAQRQDFLLLAHLDHAEPWLRNEYDRITRGLAQLSLQNQRALSNLEAIEKDRDRLLAETARLKAELARLNEMLQRVRK